MEHLRSTISQGQSEKERLEQECGKLQQKLKSLHQVDTGSWPGGGLPACSRTEGCMLLMHRVLFKILTGGAVNLLLTSMCIWCQQALSNL